VTTPANVIISTTSATCFSTQSGVFNWKISGFKLTAITSGSLVAVSGNSSIVLEVMEYGAVAAGNVQISSVNGSMITMGASYKISGSGYSHLYAGVGSKIQCAFITITTSGTPAWGLAFVFCTQLSIMYMQGLTFAGTGATGSKYYVAENSIVESYVTTFPGSTAGSAVTGGLYI